MRNWAIEQNITTSVWLYRHCTNILQKHSRKLVSLSQDDFCEVPYGTECSQGKQCVNRLYSYPMSIAFPYKVLLCLWYVFFWCRITGLAGDTKTHISSWQRFLSLLVSSECLRYAILELTIVSPSNAVRTCVQFSYKWSQHQFFLNISESLLLTFKERCPGLPTKA